MRLLPVMIVLKKIKSVLNSARVRVISLSSRPSLPGRCRLSGTELLPRMASTGGT